MALLLQETHRLDHTSGETEIHVSSELVRHAEILGVPHIHSDRPLRMASTRDGLAFLLFVDDHENLCVTWQPGSGARWVETVLKEHDINGMMVEDFDCSVDPQGVLRIVVLHAHAGKHYASDCCINDPGSEGFKAGISWRSVELRGESGAGLDGMKISIQHSALPGQAIRTIIVATNGRTLLVNRYDGPLYEDLSSLIELTVGTDPGRKIKNGSGFFGYMKDLNGRLYEEMGFCLTYEQDGYSRFLSGCPDVALGIQAYGLPEQHTCTALAPVFNLLFSGGRGLAFTRFDTSVQRFTGEFTPVTGIDVTLAPGFDRISELWVSEHVESGQADSLVGEISIWARAHATLNGAEVTSVIHLLAHVDQGRVTFSDPVALGRNCVTVAPVISSSEHKFCAITADGSLRHRELDLASGLWKDSHIALRPVEAMQSQIAYATSLTVVRDGKPCVGETVELTPDVGCSLRIHDGSGPGVICGWAEAGEAIHLITDRRGQVKVIQPTGSIASPEYAIRLAGSEIKHRPGKQSYDFITAHGEPELKAARFTTGSRSGEPVFGDQTNFGELSANLAALNASKPAGAPVRLRLVGEAPSVFERICNFLHEFVDWVGRCVVKVVKKVCSVILEVAGKVYEFLVHTLEQACHALSVVLKKVAVALGDALGWLGCELLGLNRTMAIQAAVSGTLFNALHAVRTETDHLGDFLKAKVDQGRAYLDHELDRLIAAASHHGIPSVKEKAAHVSDTVHSPAFDASCYGVNPLDFLHLGEPEILAPNLPDVSEVTRTLFSRLGNDLGSVANALVDLVMREKDQLVAMFQSDGSGAASAFGMIKALVDAIADISTAGIDAVVALFDALLDLVPILLNAEIRFAPFEALIGFLGGLIGEHDLKPTLLNLFATVPCMLAAVAIKIFNCPTAELDKLKPMPCASLLAAGPGPAMAAAGPSGWDIYQKVGGLVGPIMGLLGDGLFSFNYAKNNSGFAAGLAGIGSSICYMLQGACGLVPVPGDVNDKLAMGKFILASAVAGTLALFAAANTLITILPGKFKIGDNVEQMVLNILSILLAIADILMNFVFMVCGLEDDAAKGGAETFNIVIAWIGSLAFDIAALVMSAGGMVDDPTQEVKLVVLAVAAIATLTGTGLGVATGVLGLKGLLEKIPGPRLLSGSPINPGLA